MIYVVLMLLLLAIILGPSYWVKHTMAKYRSPNDRYPHSGAQLARLLLDEAGLPQVGVEVTEQGDHYDPIEKFIRLTQDNFNGKSLTAITVAAHEVGHAIQDRDAYLPLALRTKLVRLARPAEKVGAGILMLTPVMMAIFRIPSAAFLFLAGGLLTLGTATLIHLLTLPMELNASFSRALPLLERKQVLLEGDQPHARKILKAAAWTYIAASLMTFLNIARWLAILRRR